MQDDRVLGFVSVQIESKWPSLSQLDRRICELFFFWDVFNVFLGAMFGGAIFSQLGTSIKDPGAHGSCILAACKNVSCGCHSSQSRESLQQSISKPPCEPDCMMSQVYLAQASFLSLAQLMAA